MGLRPQRPTTSAAGTAPIGSRSLHAIGGTGSRCAIGRHRLHARALQNLLAARPALVQHHAAEGKIVVNRLATRRRGNRRLWLPLRPYDATPCIGTAFLMRSATSATTLSGGAGLLRMGAFGAPSNSV